MKGSLLLKLYLYDGPRVIFLLRPEEFYLFVGAAQDEQNIYCMYAVPRHLIHAIHDVPASRTKNAILPL